MNLNALARILVLVLLSLLTCCAKAQQVDLITSDQLRVVARVERDGNARSLRSKSGFARDDRPVMRPLANDLWLYLIADRPGTPWVTHGDLKRLKLDPGQAFEAGRRNTARLLGDPGSRARHDPEGFFVLEGDEFLSGWLMLDERWSELAEKWRGALVVATPRAQTILYAPSSNPGAVAAMARAAAPLSVPDTYLKRLLFHWTRTGWVHYREPNKARGTGVSTERTDVRDELGKLIEVVTAVLDNYVDEVPAVALVSGCDARLAAPLSSLGTLDRTARERDLYSLFDPAGISADPKALERIAACADSIFDRLDPQSYWLGREEFRILQVGAGAQGGAGLSLERAQPYPVVRLVARPGPAWDAGVRRGDRLLRVDGTSTEHWSADRAAELVRGEPGSKVVLTFAAASGERRIEVSREVTGSPDVVAAELRNRVLRLNLPSIRESSLERLLDEAGEWLDAGVDGLVLDLRGNTGGLLSEAVELASLFLPPKDVIMRMQGRAEDMRKTFRAEPPKERRLSNEQRLIAARLNRLPLAVLVDDRTAAGAEIIAAALQDHKRATIVGARTEGLAAIQTIIPMGNNQAFKITTARWVTPDEKVIQGRGVQPDLAVSPEAALPAAERLLLQSRR